MVNDTLLLSTRNQFERRRYRDQISDALSERSMSGRKKEGGIFSRMPIQTTSRTSRPTLGSTVFLNVFQSQSQGYAKSEFMENRLCTIRFVGELRPRRLRIEQTVPLITYVFFFDFASRRTSEPIYSIKLIECCTTKQRFMYITQFNVYLCYQCYMYFPYSIYSIH